MTRTQKSALKFMQTHHSCHFLKTVCLLFFVLLLGTASCGKKSTDSEEVSSQFKLVAVDSFSINRLSELELEDYHEGTGEIMMSDRQLADILVVDKEGNINHSFNPIMEGPNTIGNTSYGWTFYGEDKIVAYGRVHYHLLTKDGERIKRVLYPVETSGHSILDYNPKMITTMGEGDHLEVVTLITNPIGPNHRTQQFQDSVKMIYRLDMETGEGRPIMHKPANGALRTLGKFAGRGWPNMARLNGNRFVVGYEIDPKVYLYDVFKDSLLASFEIPQEYSPEYKSFDFGGREREVMQKSYVQVLGLGDHFIVQVLSNIPEEVMKEIMLIPNWIRSPELDAAVKKYIKSNYLLFDFNGFVQELDFNVGATEYRMLSTQKGAIWVQRTYEDERDYRTFVKYQLTRVSE